MSIIDTLRRIVRRSRRSSEAPRPRWHSVSSTREYERCPRRYRFAYVERVHGDRGLAPEGWRFGSVVHRGLETGYRHHQEVGRTRTLAHTIPVALDGVRAAWTDEGMPDDPDALGRAERVVRRSLASTRLRPRQIIGVEQHFRGLTPEGLRVAGAADLVLRTGRHGIEIRDHKVTRFVRAPEQLAGDFQLNLYGWLARRTWPWVDRVVASHHYPLTTQVVRVELSEASMRSALDRLRATAIVAEADTVFAPNPGENCATCVYTALCPDARLAAA